MKSKAHSKKCQEMGVLVSSLLDLEAEEGKIFHLINLLLLLREGGTRPGRRLLRRSSFQRCGAILFTPSSFQHPGEVSACTGWVTGRPGGFISRTV